MVAFSVWGRWTVVLVFRYCTIAKIWVHYEVYEPDVYEF
jgi:hypothetical protein